jgi:hypothetical protein
MKLKNSLASIVSLILASGISANAFATNGQLHGSGCQTIDNTISNVRNMYYGIENKNTSSSVTVVCPMTLSGGQSGDHSGPYTRLYAYVTNQSTSNPVKCRFAIRDINGAWRVTTPYASATSTGDYVQIFQGDNSSLPNLSGNYMIAECVLPKYSGSGNPPTIRTVRAE